jgi:Rrf2 family protein
MLSQTAEYALRAVLALAAEPDGRPLGAARLAGMLQIPQNYLSKTLHQLARAGVLESNRGKLGGFRLARPAGRVTLLEVVTLFDDLSARRVCLLGRSVCSDHAPCTAHRRWKAVTDQTAQFLGETTLADLMK